MNQFRFVLAGLSIAGLVLTGSAFAGNIVVNDGQWALSNTGFLVERIANGTAFAQGAAQFLTGWPKRRQYQNLDQFR